MRERDNVTVARNYLRIKKIVDLTDVPIHYVSFFDIQYYTNVTIA